MKARKGEGRRVITTMSGTNAIHAKKNCSNLGKEMMRRAALKAAAPHSELEKNIFRTTRAIVKRTGQIAKF
jgi:hypothetical protein